MSGKTVVKEARTSEMEVREGGAGETEEEKQLPSEADLDGGEVCLVNLARESNRSYQRKKKKLESETSLCQSNPCESIIDSKEPDCEEVVDKQETQASSSDPAKQNMPEKVESAHEEIEENSVVRFVVGAKVGSARVANGVRFPSELRRQVLEDLQRLPEAEVCKK